MRLNTIRLVKRRRKRTQHALVTDVLVLKWRDVYSTLVEVVLYSKYSGYTCISWIVSVAMEGVRFVIMPVTEAWRMLDLLCSAVLYVSLGGKQLHVQYKAIARTVCEKCHSQCKYCMDGGESFVDNLNIIECYTATE